MARPTQHPKRAQKHLEKMEQHYKKGMEALAKAKVELNAAMGQHKKEEQIEEKLYKKKSTKRK